MPRRQGLPGPPPYGLGWRWFGEVLLHVLRVVDHLSTNHVIHGHLCWENFQLEPELEALGVSYPDHPLCMHRCNTGCAMQASNISGERFSHDFFGVRLFDFPRPFSFVLSHTRVPSFWVLWFKIVSKTAIRMRIHMSLVLDLPYEARLARTGLGTISWGGSDDLTLSTSAMSKAG